MGIVNVLSLLGGLALFLYGMHMMGDGLSLLAGSKLKNILERLTRNRYLGMLVGVGLTALIQSSNAMTAMVIGFVNARLMDFSQAVGVVMGARIGTTITGQLIALNVTDIAPVFAFVGIVLFLFVKNKKLHYLGQVIAGLGILFMGLNTMSAAMAPLKDAVWFQNAVTSIKNPVVGVLVGTAFTMLVQSCSASVGVLQAMAMQGLVTLGGSIYVLFGLNIGTIASALMASIGGNKDAKRTVLVHFLFNLTGTVLFMVVCQFLPFVPWVESLTPGNPVAQIANANTIFNVVTTMVLLPCAGLLIRIANKLIPGTDEETGLRLRHIDDGGFAAASIAIGQVDAEVGRMQALARKNLHAALDTLTGRGDASPESIDQNEEIIDFLNKEITRVLIRINAMELTQADAQRMSGMYHVLSDIERIGDHAENIAGYAAFCRERQQSFTPGATAELRGLADMVCDMVDQSYKHFIEPWDGKLDEIYDLEERIDERVDALNAHHITRLNEHRCTPDLGMIFVEVLTDLERVADHALNIAQAAVSKKA